MTKKRSSDRATDADTIMSTDAGPTTRHGDACLVVIRGARLGTRVPLDNAQLTIGRDGSCDFQISERNVSRTHCRFTRHGQVWWVEDLGSTNRTMLDDKAIERSVLADGDQIRIGGTVLKFIAAGNIEADYHSELHENAYRDALTGLYNRRQLISVLQHEIRKRRSQTSSPLALALIDIDHFKRVNDELGHLGGDSALKQLTAILNDHTETRDVIARIGGEEFALLLGESEIAQARARLERLREAVESYGFEIEGQPRSLTISIGVVPWSPEVTSTSDFLRAADERLFIAKNGGRNRVC